MSFNNDYQETPYRSKKNTKRWCKGKVGVEHTYSDWNILFPNFFLFITRQRACTTCGRKELDVSRI